MLVVQDIYNQSKPPPKQPSQGHQEVQNATEIEKQAESQTWTKQMWLLWRVGQVPHLQNQDGHKRWLHGLWLHRPMPVLYWMEDEMTLTPGFRIIQTKNSIDLAVHWLENINQLGVLDQWLSYFLESVESEIGVDGLEEIQELLTQRYDAGGW